MTQTRKKNLVRAISAFLVAFMLLALVVPSVAVFAGETENHVNNEAQVDSGSSDSDSNGSSDSGEFTPEDMSKSEGIVNNMFDTNSVNIDFGYGNKVMSPIKTIVYKLASILIALLMLYLPVTFIADVLSTLLPFSFMDKILANEKFKLVSSHKDKLKDKPSEYFKDRTLELVIAFVLLGLVISNAYMAILQFCVSFAIQLVGILMGFIKSFMSGLV